MKNPFKNLFRRSRGNEALTKVGRVTPCAPSSPPPTSEDASPPFPTPDAPSPAPGVPLDPPTARNGKIAKLPRPIRDKINRAFDAGQSAVYITEQLNKLPEVKAAMDAHFGGRPITPQNLGEWKAGGYRDWLARQELLRQKSELSADANDMAETAKGLPDSLFGMVMLDYARLLKNADKDSPEEFEKKRKVLSNMLQDVVRIRRCDTQARGVEVQEERLERDREKTSEEIFLKFMEWAGNPEIRRTFILEPMVCMALQRRHFGLPPRPEDEKVLKEYGYVEPAKNQGNQTETAPHRTENPEADSLQSKPEPEPQRGSVTQPGVVPPGGTTPGSAPNNPLNSERVASDPKPADVDSPVSPIRPISPISPSTPPPTSEAIANNPSIENAGPTASPLSQRERAGVRESLPNENPVSVHREDEQSTNSTLNTQNSSLHVSPTPDAPRPAPLPKPPLSDYEKAILEGKSPLEALYAQFTPPPEILEERKRQQAEAAREARIRESQSTPWSEPCYPHAPKPPQPGFSPPPTILNYTKSIFPELHHPSDNSKCHTS